MTNEPTCAWCESEHIAGNREDVGRPLTKEEASAGFLAVHAGCRPKMDELFARLATKGVFVALEGRNERHGLNLRDLFTELQARSVACEYGERCTGVDLSAWCESCLMDAASDVVLGMVLSDEEDCDRCGELAANHDHIIGWAHHVDGNTWMLRPRTQPEPGDRMAHITFCPLGGPP